MIRFQSPIPVALGLLICLTLTASAFMLSQHSDKREALTNEASDLRLSRVDTATHESDKALSGCCGSAAKKGVSVTHGCCGNSVPRHAPARKGCGADPARDTIATNINPIPVATIPQNAEAISGRKSCGCGGN